MGKEQMDVVKIGKAAPIDYVVQELEQALAMAKSGEMRAFYMVASMRDEKTIWMDAGAFDRFVLLGQINRMQHILNREMDEFTELWSPEKESDE